MTVQDVVYLVCAVLISVVLVGKFRHLRRRWDSPRVWALYATVLFPAAAVWFGSPASHRLVNRMTGYPNLGVLLAAGCITAFAASALALALLWRYPPGTAWLRLRWILPAYGLVIVAMVVLFGLSSVPEELPIDFIVRYATQPTIAAFFVIYFVAALIGVAGLAACCFSWARDPAYRGLPWLRRGLRLYGATGLVLAVYDVESIAGVVANWFGVRALDRVSTTAPMFVMLAGSCTLIAALVVPVWGPRWPGARRRAGRWRAFLTLLPLHRALRHVDPSVVFVAPGKRLDPYHRVRRMMIELGDWRWVLAALFDPAAGERAARLGRESGLRGDPLKAAIEAAQLKAASRAWHDGHRPSPGGTPDQHGDARDGSGIDSELTWWIQVARAYTSSTVRTGALARARAASPGRADTEPLAGGGEHPGSP